MCEGDAVEQVAGQRGEAASGEGRERVVELEGELAEARRTIEQMERRQRIDALLAESETVDFEAARLLTERAVAEMDEPDVAMAVEDLRRHRPWLFSRRERGESGVMSARVDEEAETAASAASRAATSGHRRDLLAYLRLRRRG